MQTHKTELTYKAYKYLHTPEKSPHEVCLLISVIYSSFWLHLGPDDPRLKQVSRLFPDRVKPLCKEEIEKGRKESKAEMEKWAKSVEDNTKAQFELLREEVRLISETSVSLANKMEVRKKEVDDTLNDQSDSITSMETKLKELEKEMLTLRRRSEDLEARSRRNNIRIVGVREGAETGKTPLEFIAGLLKEKLGLSVTPTLDRAHRTLGARRDGAGAPPRAFVVRCHYYIEKEEILKKAREMERTPEGRSGRIHIFPDYTQEVNNKRAAFKEARSLLIDYLLLDKKLTPMVMHVEYPGIVLSDHSPVTLKLKFPDYTPPQRMWRLNSRLLADDD
uniref:L1 transposable element RRM domain-containing protein n=1 Tax=Haplochromis burtoni TaxID=8153 RepID=A0A3Q2VGQ4_HAPBU